MRPRPRKTPSQGRLPQPSALEAALDRHSGLLLASLLGLALVLGIWRRFVLDDAFISFEYARSLIEGHGLTWFGTRVEGYSNFLWVLWIAGGLALGINAVTWSQIGGIAAFLAAVWGVWRLGGRVFGARLPALAGSLLFVTNYTVASYATGGLETMLHTALLCWVAVVLYDVRAAGRASTGRCLAVSGLAALAILTRLDSVVPLAVLAVATPWFLPRPALTRRCIALLVGPGALLVAAWLAWKVGYYHGLLPNSFYCKVGGNPLVVLNGLRYVQRFFAWYLLWPFLAAGAAVLAWRRLPIPAGVAPLLALAVSWCLYVVVVGGDFMEFRFLVPATPWLFLLTAYCVHDLVGVAALRRPATAVVVSLGILLAASIRHGMTFRGMSADRALDSIPTLASFYDVYRDGDWGRIGRALRADLEGVDATIALHAVGAIPFFSRIRTVDMYGLNDPFVAAHGLRAPASDVRPGHQVRASQAYLRQRGVSFTLGHPTLIPNGRLFDPAEVPRLGKWLDGCQGFDPDVAAQAVVVALPVDDGSALLAWYLSPTPALDERIRSRGWQRRVVTKADFHRPAADAASPLPVGQ